MNFRKTSKIQKFQTFKNSFFFAKNQKFSNFRIFEFFTFNQQKQAFNFGILPFFLQFKKK